ncbi:hypothetical protein GCM10023350_06300 [Nocardioides endophyticus]|uniref:Secreted protein n=1 Tax=Nocardioides endophyticus TaxID=1353775 RepID=A0ABP8YEZ2_9ACTN
MWSTLWPFIVTALLTLGVASTVQLYVVPRVEARKRREDRWERDVRALGELLTFEQSAAAQALSTTLWKGAFVNRPALGWQADKVAEAKSDVAKELREAQADYRRVGAQVEWLSDRVEGLGENLDGLTPFKAARRGYQLQQIELTALIHEVWNGNGGIAAPPTIERVDSITSNELVAVRELVSTLSALADGQAPRPAVPGRLRGRILPSRR